MQIGIYSLHPGDVNQYVKRGKGENTKVSQSNHVVMST